MTLAGATLALFVAMIANSGVAGSSPKERICMQLKGKLLTSAAFVALLSVLGLVGASVTAWAAEPVSTISTVDPPADEVVPTAPPTPASGAPISKEPDPNAVDPGMGPTAVAPLCFTLAQWEEETRDGWQSHATSRNECSATYRVRFIWAWATDGPCTSVPPNWVLSSWRWNRPPYISELRIC